MQSVRDGEIKTKERRNLDSRQTWMRVIIVLGLTILYVVTFRSIINNIGPVGAALITIPVATVGWFFGVNAGLVASLLSIILSTALLTALEENNWILWITVGWPGDLMIILVGFISGRLSESINEYKHAEAESRSRERYLTLLKLATSDILNPKNPGDRYYYLIAHFVNLFVADYGYFFRWDAKQEQAILIASTLPIEQQFSSALLKPGKSATIKSVLQTERPLVIDNVLNSQDTINATFFKNLAFPVHSALGIPIIAREHKLGVMILTYNALRHFTAEEINHAEQGGQQVALALWNVQQEVDIQKRLRESDALIKITRTLSETERIGLQTVLQLIVTSAKELISSTEQAVIHLLDEEKQLLTAEAVVGYAENVTAWKLLKIRPNEGVAGLVIVNGETINIADISTDPRFLPTSTTPSYRSLMVAPVQSGERKLGTISVQSSLVDAFTEAESQLLTALGIQASIAIENANLLEKTKQSLKETNVLYHINQGLAASSFDPDQLMDMVVDVLYNNFRYYHVHIYLIDPQSGDLVSRHGRGEAAQEFIKTGARLPVATGIIGHVAETRQPFITNNVNDVIFYAGHPLLHDTKSELAVPIMINGEALGVLNVEDRSNIPLHHLSMMSTIANQLAVALQKANLYAELQTSLQQEKAIRNQLVQNERLTIMGRLLASVSHELNNPLQAIQNALFLLKEEKGISTQGQQDLNIVLAESERMGNMIEQLRATYRPIQAEDFSPTQMNEIIENVHALISPHLRHNQIAFEFHPQPELPAIPALSDQIRQVVLNLLMNAVEAMPTGGNLTVATDFIEDKNEILLTVSDTGTGISPAILPNIFEAFITDKQKGTGLGLTISYDIVIKHRGRITAQNNEDRGATFKVWLPTQSGEIS